MLRIKCFWAVVAPSVSGGCFFRRSKAVLPEGFAPTSWRTIPAISGMHGPKRRAARSFQYRRKGGALVEASGSLAPPYRNLLMVLFAALFCVNASADSFRHVTPSFDVSSIRRQAPGASQPPSLSFSPGFQGTAKCPFGISPDGQCIPPPHLEPTHITPELTIGDKAAPKSTRDTKAKECQPSLVSKTTGGKITVWNEVCP